MSKYDVVKVGDKVTFIAVHYNYFSKTDKKGLIWVKCETLDEEDNYLGGGYIKNIYPEGYFESADGTIDKTKVYQGVIVDVKVMEHENGNRNNHNQYNSIAEYFADPLVKDLVAKKCRSHILDFTVSDADRVDIIYTIRFLDSTFTIKESEWEDFVPQEWYDEIFADVLDKLEVLDHYEDASIAQANQEHTDDMFGERYFPVLKGPIDKFEVFRNHAESFKNHSKPMIRNGFVYFGLRAKGYELEHFSDVYADGGVILKNVEWEW